MTVGSISDGPTYAFTYNGNEWSAPTEIDSHRGNTLHSVSCGSPTFCVTVGNFGVELTYSAGKWSEPDSVGNSVAIDSVSCPSESFCMAHSRAETIRYNGSSWSEAAAISEGAASGGLSCLNESFCMAVDGRASTYNGSNWSEAVSIGGGGLSSVSCSSISLCTAVDYHGRVLTYNGSAWSAPNPINPQGSLTSVSCPAAAFCAAVGGYHHGYALIFDGATWSAPAEVDKAGTLTSVSCTSATFCAALAEDVVEGHAHGFALTYDGSSWSTLSEIDANATLRSVSCVSSSFCVAVGEHDAVIYNGSSWTTPNHLYPKGGLYSVSCASTSFCMAVGEDAFGEALIYNGATWSTPSVIPIQPEHVESDAGVISCVSSQFCMATARFEGKAGAFEGTTWAPWVSLETNGDFSSVSCPAATLCVVVNLSGEGFTYSGPALGTPIAGSGGGVAVSPASVPVKPALERHTPRVNYKTGEITLEYEFPEPGELQADGEVINGVVVADLPASYRLAGNARRCRKGYTRRGSHCTYSGFVPYGEAKRVIATAGIYRIRIIPGKRVQKALRKNNTLSVRLAVVFSPSGTTEHFRETTTLRLRLNGPHRSNHE